MLIKELEEVNQEFVTPRLSTVVDQVEEIVIDEKAMIANEQVIVPITRDGYVKRVSMRSYNASNDVLSMHKDSDKLVTYGSASTLDTLLFFTNRGTYGYLSVYQLEEAKWKDLGSHLSSYIKMDAGEKIIQAYLLSSFDESVEVLCVSRFGMIKRTNLKELQVSRSNKTMVCMKIGSLDEMVSVALSYSPDDVVILSSEQGFALSYPVDQVPQVSCRSKGVKAINLVKDDHVADMIVVSNLDGQLVVVSDTAQMKRIKASDIAQVKRPAKGNRICKLVKSNPVKIDRLLSKQLNDVIEFQHDELVRFAAKEVSLMSCDSTFSSPFGKVEEFEIPSSLEMIHSGSWSNTDKEEIEQVSLFEVEA